METVLIFRDGLDLPDFASFVLLDDPALPQPIRANLFQSGDDKTAWSLHWNRPKPRGEQD